MNNNIEEKVLSTDLVFGDVIYLKTPYEENTKDFYHGYDVLDVVGDYVKDHNNKTYKVRPVMVVAVEDDELIYTPITSKHNKFKSKDIQHQYKCHEPLANNKNYTTYVELNSIRAVHTKNFYKYTKHGELKPRDKQAVLGAFVNNYTNYAENKDCRKFVTPKHKRKFENKLEKSGFEKVDNTYKQGNLEISISEKGIIKYHHNYSLEEVKEKHNQIINTNKKLFNYEVTI